MDMLLHRDTLASFFII